MQQPSLAPPSGGAVGRSVVEKLSGNSSVPLILGGAFVIALVAGLLMWANKPAYRVLYSGIGEADGGAIITELETRGVDYQIGAGGGSIMVPADQVHELRLKLAEQGLPDSGNVGFEIMDNQSFGISQFSEQVNFQRSLEGELAASIRALAPVKDARVHLALAKPAIFIRERDPSKASVLLHLHAGRTLGDAQVAAITHMVASSVAELQPSDVSVVDQHGNLLSSNPDATQEFDREHLAYAEEVEARYRARIEKILRPMFGADNFQVQVAADLDFSTHEETAERYAPNQDPSVAAVRSLQTTTKVQNGDWPISGVPGALSNTPPGWLPSPISNPEPPAQAEEVETTEGGKGNNENTAYDHNNTVNYEVDRSVIHTRREAGQIERLSVGVVVNHRLTAAEDGTPEWTALNEEELDAVRGLVQQAMGYSERRGDQLRVVNAKFAESPVAAPEVIETPWWQQPAIWRMAESLLKYLLTLFIIWFVYKKVMKPLMERYARALETARSLPAPSAKPIEDTDDAFDDVPEAKPAGKMSPRQAPDKLEYDLPIPKGDDGVAYEAALTKIREMALENPKGIAQTVSRWINTD